MASIPGALWYEHTVRDDEPNSDIEGNSVQVMVKLHSALYSNGIVVRHAFLMLVAMNEEHDIAFSTETTAPASFMLLPGIILLGPASDVPRPKPVTRLA